MPEHWYRAITSELTASLAVAVGATLRGLLGPGDWSWREWGLGIAVGLAFAYWVAPGVVEYMELGESAYGGVCVALGMTAKNIARGMIGLSQMFARSPETFLGRERDRDD